MILFFKSGEFRAGLIDFGRLCFDTGGLFCCSGEAGVWPTTQAGDDP